MSMVVDICLFTVMPQLYVNFQISKKQQDIFLSRISSFMSPKDLTEL